MSYDSMKRDEAVAALRAAADLIESLPIDKWWYVSVEAFNLTAEEMALVARSPGTWEKSLAGTDNDIFQLTQGVVEVHAPREQVCVARPTGKKVTTKKVVTPAVYEDVEVDEVVWDCQPLLSKAKAVLPR